jgi:hypothetical protein
VLGRSAQYIECLIWRDALAFDEDAFGLTDGLPDPEGRDEVVDSVEPYIERQGGIFPGLNDSEGDAGVIRKCHRFGAIDGAVGTDIVWVSIRLNRPNSETDGRTVCQPVRWDSTADPW